MAHESRGRALRGLAEPADAVDLLWDATRDMPCAVRVVSGALWAGEWFALSAGELHASPGGSGHTRVWSVRAVAFWATKHLGGGATEPVRLVHFEVRALRG